MGGETFRDITELVDDDVGDEPRYPPSLWKTLFIERRNGGIV